jgi:6-pyruvoyltetrahydropterin/6-carboxytetrahydropterin synthase
MKVTVCRREHFNAAHRLHNPAWSDEKNREIFGLCNNANFHGHNYELIVKVSGVPDVNTGYVIDMKVLSDLIKANVLDRFDHKNLNLDTEDFKTLIPTAENISVVIWKLLRRKIDKQLDIKVILYETARNFVEYPSN